MQGQLKGHLNGLYRGFTSIMQSTAQIDPDKRQVPFEVEKAMHNIMFIKHHMKRQDEFDAVRRDNGTGSYKKVGVKIIGHLKEISQCHSYKECAFVGSHMI